MQKVEYITNEQSQADTQAAEEEKIVSKDDDHQLWPQQQQPPQYGGIHYDVNETISNRFVLPQPSTASSTSTSR